MNGLFIYMVKVAIYLAAFYCVYALMLSRDTFYGRNRAFIIIAAISSMLLPLISLQTLKPMGIQFFGKVLSDVFITASANNQGESSHQVTLPSVLNIIYILYIAGVIIFLLKFIINFLNLLFLIQRQKSTGTKIIRFHGFNTSGFSAMGFIFLNSRLRPREAAEIIRHEQNHLKNNHFIDIIFFEIFKSFQWFNPTVYLFDRSLRAIHEYQADQGCINSGVTVEDYQLLLFSHVFKSKSFNLSNSFSNPSLVKKRMIMMTKKRTSALASIKLLLVFPVAALVFFSISAYKEIPAAPVLKTIQTEVSGTQESLSPVPAIKNSNIDKEINKKEFMSKASSDQSAPVEKSIEKPVLEDKKATETLSENIESEPFVVVEEMPIYPGGDVELLRYIGENTIYPEVSKINSIQGRVIVRFCVTPTGGVSQISVLKSVSPELDAEAMRVVSTLSGFIPGKQGGKTVPVWYMVPITFALQ